MAGTFLYVALMDIVMNEFRARVHIASKIASLLLGFGFMALLGLWM